MATFDLSPYFRSSVGFDRVADMLDDALRATESDGYPPYNIEHMGENAYRITMAVAGLTEGDLNVVQHENTLVVTGKGRQPAEGTQFLHRGIAGRAFERRFSLADYVKVNSASLANGLLVIELAREVPEAMKPRTIQIGGASVKPIQSKAA